VSAPKGTDLERERIACVFGLGGGELHVADARFPDDWDGLVAYWYEGVPEYSSELRHLDGARTVITCCLFGHPEPPAGWEQVASFTSSGEAACWWCGEGTGNDAERLRCKLCEGDGLVFLGDGWCEVVYVCILQGRCPRNEE
jgi:hypothetical protein